MEGNIENKSNIYLIIKQELKWIWYQIVASFTPLLLGCIFKLIIGYHIDLYEMMSDYLLAVFAIGMNLKGQELKERKNMHQIFVDLFTIVSKIVIFFSIIFYVGLFNGSYIAEKITNSLKTRTDVLVIIMSLFGTAIIFDSVLAIINDCKYRCEAGENEA